MIFKYFAMFNPYWKLKVACNGWVHGYWQNIWHFWMRSIKKSVTHGQACMWTLSHQVPVLQTLISIKCQCNGFCSRNDLQKLGNRIGIEISMLHIFLWRERSLAHPKILSNLMHWPNSKYYIFKSCLLCRHSLKYSLRQLLSTFAH